MPKQTANELFANRFSRAVQVEGTDAPLFQVDQCRPRQLPFRLAIAIGENQVEFVNRGGWQHQPITFALEKLPEIVGEVLLSGEIEDDISVERELLVLRSRRHRSSPFPC